MKKDWKYEIARDSMAFGSILFYLIIIVRAIIGKYLPFVYQLLISIIILILLSFIIKNVNHHIARAFVLVIFTSLFYKDILFSFFAAVVWIFIIGSAFYIKESKKSIYKGIVLGIVTVLVSYYMSLVVG